MNIDLNLTKELIEKHHNSVLSVNIRSFNKHKDQINLLLDKISPNIINFCEIFHPQNLYLRGYSNIAFTRKSRKGGGISIFVMDDTSYIERKDINSIKTELLEKVAVEITQNHNNFLLVGLYSLHHLTLNALYKN